MNTLNLAPEQATLGRFYFELHASAERLRELMKNTPSAAITRQDESAAQGAEANQLIKAGELVKDSSKRRGVKTIEVQL